MTDYTPAKDRLLVALAAYHKDSGDHWTQKAARAVLEEERGGAAAEPCICPCHGRWWVTREYYEGLQASRTELAELKRRVERAISTANAALEAGHNDGAVWWRDGLGKAACILAGKDT